MCHRSTLYWKPAITLLLHSLWVAGLAAEACAGICQEQNIPSVIGMDVDFIDNDHRFNLDDAGGLDVVVCDTCSTQVVTDLGTATALWTLDRTALGFGPVSIVAFGDVDADGTREVIMQCQNSVAPPGGTPQPACTANIIVYDYAAQQIDFSLGSATVQYSVVFVGDVDGDGQDELVVAGVDDMGFASTLIYGPGPCPITAVTVEDLRVTSTPDGILLTWNLTEDPMLELSGVQVQRAVRPEGPYEAVSPLLSDLTSSMSFADLRVAEGSTYWYRLLLVRRDGTRVTSRPSAVVTGVAPAEVDLRIAHDPGDVGPVEIRYRLDHAEAQVQLGVYDIRGRSVRLLDMGPRHAGEWVSSWDRLDSTGRPVSRGVYFLRLETENVMISRKVVLSSR